MVALGKHINAADPKRGWDATSRRLADLVNGGHGKLPTSLSGEFQFLEQVNQCVQTMKHAWRNKVNHVEGRLTVLATDFTPEIAEEIMMASRGFMRRLAAEMPKQQQRYNDRQDMKKTPDSPTFARFTAAMQTIMKVPKTAIQTGKKHPSK